MFLLDQLKSVERGINMRFLSCEGEIISFLLKNGPSKPKEIVDASNYSNVHVYNKLKNLVALGVVEKLSNGSNCRYVYKIWDDFGVKLLKK